MTSSAPLKTFPIKIHLVAYYRKNFDLFLHNSTVTIQNSILISTGILKQAIKFPFTFICN